jgi:hypothetical protein
MSFFTGIEKSTQKFLRKFKGYQIAKVTLRK